MIGLLYFFNFVNGPTMAKLDGPTKKLLVPQLMPRALFWFRWGAAVTWLTGITLFTMIYMMREEFLGGAELGERDRRPRLVDPPRRHVWNHHGVQCLVRDLALANKR